MFIMQSESKETPLNKNLNIVIVSIIFFVIIYLCFFKNVFFKSTYVLKTFGELSVDPEIAFNNNKPTFLEFYFQNFW